MGDLPGPQDPGSLMNPAQAGSRSVPGPHTPNGARGYHAPHGRRPYPVADIPGGHRNYCITDDVARVPLCPALRISPPMVGWQQCATGICSRAGGGVIRLRASHRGWRYVRDPCPRIDAMVKGQAASPDPCPLIPCYAVPRDSLYRLYVPRLIGFRKNP
jgi:hypothetical protein